MGSSGLGTHVSADHGRICEAVSFVVNVSAKHISKHGSLSNKKWCLDLGCLKDNLWWGLPGKKVVVMHKL